MNINKDPIISPDVGKSLNAAKQNLKGLLSSLGGGLSKGLEGTGIESHAGVMTLNEKANLFDGTAIMERFEQITDMLSGLSSQASVETAALRFVPGVSKLNSFIDGVADSLLKMGNGGAKLLNNLRDALFMAKENIVDSLHNDITNNRDLIENDGGFSELDEVEQRLALTMLIEQEEKQIHKMMASLNYDEETQVTGLGVGELLSKISLAAKQAKDVGFGVDMNALNSTPTI